MKRSDFSLYVVLFIVGFLIGFLIIGCDTPTSPEYTPVPKDTTASGAVEGVNGSFAKTIGSDTLYLTIKDSRYYWEATGLFIQGQLDAYDEYSEYYLLYDQGCTYAAVYDLSLLPYSQTLHLNAHAEDWSCARVAYVVGAWHRVPTRSYDTDLQYKSSKSFWERPIFTEGKVGNAALFK